MISFHKHSTVLSSLSYSKDVHRTKCQALTTARLTPVKYFSIYKYKAVITAHSHKGAAADHIYKKEGGDAETDHSFRVQRRMLDIQTVGAFTMDLSRLV